MSGDAETNGIPGGRPRVQRPAGLDLVREACDVRRDVVDALHACGGGHYGGALSVVDIVLTLYRSVLRVCPDHPAHPDRDRFILSKGHAAIALYAVLRRVGFFRHPLSEYGRAGSSLQGHPDMTRLPGVDFSTGSLGQGLSAGLGIALAVAPVGGRVWVVLGDGECQEGQVWEAAMLAARYRVANLHAVVDANGHQEWGWADDPRAAPEPVEALAAKWAAFGWDVRLTDGHDAAALQGCYRDMMRADGRPSVAVARTVKGRGFAALEADPRRFHCTVLDDAEYASLTRGQP